MHLTFTTISTDAAFKSTSFVFHAPFYFDNIMDIWAGFNPRSADLIDLFIYISVDFLRNNETRNAGPLSSFTHLHNPYFCLEISKFSLNSWLEINPWPEQGLHLGQQELPVPSHNIWSRSRGWAALFVQVAARREQCCLERPSPSSELQPETDLV